MSRDAEHQEQSLLFQWAEHAGGRIPELRLLFAIPNFSGRLGKVPPVAARIQAGKLNREGRKRGVPDVCLPVARGGFHALYLEMKAGKNRPTPEQIAWLKDLTEQGNLTAVCVGWEAARDRILGYLALTKLEHAS